MNVDPATAVGAILTVVVGAAAWINERRKNSANNSRQIKNDENATEWQNGILAENKELKEEIKQLTTQKNDYWIIVMEARSELDQMRAETLLWKSKYEQAVLNLAEAGNRVNEHIAVLNSALESANEENERLRARLKGQP